MTTAPRPTIKTAIFPLTPHDPARLLLPDGLGPTDFGANHALAWLAFMLGYFRCSSLIVAVVGTHSVRAVRGSIFPTTGV